MNKYQFVTIDTILSKYHRDFKGLGINEGDAIEWIGEALGFARAASSSEEAVAFIEVKNFQADIPNGLHYIIQIARHNNWTPEGPESCSPEVIIPEIVASDPCQDSCSSGWTDKLVPVHCDGSLVGDFEVAYYRPYFDLQYEYLGWANCGYRQNNFSPVRLSNHSFFSTLVCQEPHYEGLYNSCRDEYTIIEDQLRFNFKDGFVAVAYRRQRIDQTTGYPMVPDDESAKAAITYYLAWKFKQREAYIGREGAMGLSKDAEAQWLKYIKQFKSKSKMPTRDQMQNMAETTRYLVPTLNRYYGFFGKLGTPEIRSRHLTR